MKALNEYPTPETDALCDNTPEKMDAHDVVTWCHSACDLLMNMERRLAASHETLNYVLANHHEGGDFETRILETLAATKV